MPIIDLRSRWACAICGDHDVTKRGTRCPACERDAQLLRAADQEDREAQLRFDIDAAGYGSVIGWRGIQDVAVRDGLL